MYNPRKLIAGVALLGVLLAASCGTKDLVGPPPPTGNTPPVDTMWLSTDTVSPGDTAEVLLFLSNPDSSIASFNLWLHPSTMGIKYDTLALVSPRFPVTGMEWLTGRTDSVNVVSILAVDFQGPVTIPPGSGPVMKLRYAVHPALAPGTYSLDTSSVLLTSGAKALDISYSSGLMSPDVGFVPGFIVVQ